MNFYHSTHRYYCGIELHACSLYAYEKWENTVPMLENPMKVL